MNFLQPALAVSIIALVIGLCAATVANAQAEEQNVLTRERVLRDPDVPALGNQKGDITIVEYFDYQCPYCKKLHPVILAVAKEDGNLRLVFKDWPIFGDVSKYAARLVLATKYQGKYEQARGSLLNAKSKLTEGSIRQLLTEAGVDVARAASDLQNNGKAIDDLLGRNNAQAEAFGFQGTRHSSSAASGFPAFSMPPVSRRPSGMRGPCRRSSRSLVLYRCSLSSVIGRSRTRLPVA